MFDIASFVVQGFCLIGGELDNTFFTYQHPDKEPAFVWDPELVGGYRPLVDVYHLEHAVYVPVVYEPVDNG